MKFKVFVSHSFNDNHHLVDVSTFRNLVADIFREIEIELSAKVSEGVIFEIYFEDTHLGKPLPTELRSRIAECQLYLADLAGLRPNTFYELGYAHALGRELVLFESASPNVPIPADIADLLIGRYETLAQLRVGLKMRLTSAVSPLVSQYLRSTLRPQHRCFWFEPDVKEIHIICAEEPERTRFAATDSSDYLYIDNLDDRDALFEVTTYLSRSFPDAKIVRHVVGHHSNDVLESNIVVLGGPRSNQITLDIAATLDARFRYVDGESTLIFRSGECEVTLSAKFDAKGLLISDVGYFGLFLNPFNRNNRIVMCHGCHTFGTLAACLVLADNNQALDNLRGLVKQRTPSEFSRIECAFEASILSNRRIVTPKLVQGASFCE